MRELGCVVFLVALLSDFRVLAHSTLNNNLREACANSEFDMVQSLLQEGANPNAIGDSPQDPNETPLHLACIGGNVNIVKALLEAGSVIDARATGPKSLRMTPLTWCAYGGHDDAVLALLDAGANPNLIVDEEQGLTLTALDIADRVGDSFGGRTLKTKQYLISAGGKRFQEL